jgi:hypothetical protein
VTRITSVTLISVAQPINYFTGWAVSLKAGSDITEPYRQEICGSEGSVSLNNKRPAYERVVSGLS